MKRCIKSSYEDEFEIPEYEVEFGTLELDKYGYWNELPEQADLYDGFDSEEEAIKFAEKLDPRRTYINERGTSRESRELGHHMANLGYYVSVLEVYPDNVDVIWSKQYTGDDYAKESVVKNGLA